MTQQSSKIAIASGKGGTGKTTVATNLAVVLANTGKRVVYLDCDVEEPNGHIFLKPRITEQFDVTVPVPVIDAEKCTLCGKCSAACEFHAIAVLGKTVEVFASLCHGCGSCSDVCSENAIKETARTIGVVSCGDGMGVAFGEGRLNVGEAISPPVTRALKKLAIPAEITIIDAPPGTSCPVIEAIASTDFVLLVTEPTPFGLNDLKLAVGMVHEVGLPFAVVVNRADIGNGATEEYCKREGIDILLSIPYMRQIATAYSRGEMMYTLDGGFEKALKELYQTIADRVNNHGTGDCQR